MNDIRVETQLKPENEKWKKEKETENEIAERQSARKTERKMRVRK